MPTFEEKLQQIEEALNKLKSENGSWYSANMAIGQLCWLLSSAYPQDVQQRVNKLVGTFNEISNKNL